MSSKDAQPNTSTNTSTTKPQLKICCACPDTKRPRDECIAQFGEDKCGELIEMHKKCLREAGFNV
jgi:cytochrome c oxidase assembly protein subunit 17